MAAPIGNPTVRLTADTTQFVSGMARSENVMRRVEQTAIKSRSAISGLGSALRMPGFGRAAAFGNIGGAAASALGLGALGGGVTGIAATGVFLAIDAAVAHFRRSSERLAEEQAKAAEAAKKFADAWRAAAEAAASIRSDYAGTGARDAALGAFNTENAERLRSLQAQRDAIRERFQAGEVSRDTFLRETARLNELVRQQLEIADAERARIRERFAEPQQREASKALGFLGGRDLPKELADIRSKADEIASILNKTAENEREAVLDELRQMTGLLDELVRNDQQQSGQITTALSRVATQMLLLQRRRER